MRLTYAPIMTAALGGLLNDFGGLEQNGLGKADAQDLSSIVGSLLPVDRATSDGRLWVMRASAIMPMRSACQVAAGAYAPASSLGPCTPMDSSSSLSVFAAVYVASDSPAMAGSTRSKLPPREYAGQRGDTVAVSDEDPLQYSHVMA